MMRERVGRSAGFALMTQLIGAAFTAVLMVFLGRQLSPTQYGYFAFAASITILATLFADMGISASAGRFLAERINDRPAAAQVFYTALRLKLLLAGAVALVLCVLAGPICSLFGSAGAAWTLRGAALALVGQSMFLLLLGGFAALRKQQYGTILAFAESAVELCASVVLVLAGTAAAGAAMGRAIGYAVGLGVGLVLAARVVGRSRRSAPGSPLLTRRILSYAGPLMLVDAAFRAFTSIDVLLISAILGGGAAVANYELPVRLALVLAYPAAAVASAVTPRLARLDGRPDTSMFQASVRYLTLLQMAFVPVLLIWPEEIFDLLFGDSYPDAPAVLRALVPFVFLSAVAQPVTLAVNYLGEARRRIPIAVAMLSVNAVIDIALLPRMGVVAAAIGSSAAYLVWVPAHFWVMHRHADLPLRPILSSTGRAALAGAAMAGTLALVGTGDVGLLRMTLGGLLGIMVYVLALLALREVRPDELTALGRVALRRSSQGRMAHRRGQSSSV